jgi:hypothetical protein
MERAMDVKILLSRNDYQVIPVKPNITPSTLTKRSSNTHTINPKSICQTVRRSSNSNTRPNSTLDNHSSHRRYISSLPLNLSQINAPSNHNLFSMAERIETEVDEDQIYLKHFFRNKEKENANNRDEYEQSQREPTENFIFKDITNAYDDSDSSHTTTRVGKQIKTRIKMIRQC